MPVAYAAPPTTMGARDSICQIAQQAQVTFAHIIGRLRSLTGQLSTISVEQAETPFHSICK